MVHILFLILKIIGIILLTILGILILLLLVVLFVPLRYEIKASADDDMKKAKLEVKFSWLLHLLAGEVKYLDEKLDYKIRILWKKISADTLEKGEAAESTPEEKEKAEEVVDVVLEKTDPEKMVDSILEKEETEQEEKAEENKLEKIKCTIKKVCDKIKVVLEFLKGEAHINAFSTLKKELIRLLVFLKPKRINGKVRFGMEDPYQTGQILAVLSVLYPIYAESIEIYPEFDNKVLEGDLNIKGKIRGIYAAIVAFHIIIDKNVRTTIKDIKSLL